MTIATITTKKKHLMKSGITFNSPVSDVIAEKTYNRFHAEAEDKRHAA
jgi:hypothetical protein